MAASRAADSGSDYEDIPAYCRNCDCTDQDGSGVCPDCRAPAESATDCNPEWNTIDCYKVKDSAMGHLLMNIIRVWDENNFRHLSLEIEKAREFFNA